MSKIYKDQTSLQIKLTTNVDLSDATTLLIKYEKPDGTLGSFTASVSDASEGIIYYNVVTDDLDLEGDWKFWAYVTFSDGRSAPGEVIKQHIYLEGE